MDIKPSTVDKFSTLGLNLFEAVKDRKRSDISSSSQSAPLQNKLLSRYKTMNIAQLQGLKALSSLERTEIYMNALMDIYSNLMEVVNTMDEKLVANALNAQDFLLLAYRYRFKDIHKEMAELRAQFTEERIKLKRDTKISMLEQERNWYGEELLKADKKLKEYEVQIKGLQEKYEEILRDNANLYKQIIILKKEMKVKIQEKIVQGSKEEAEAKYEVKKLPEYESKDKDEIAEEMLVKSLQKQLQMERRTNQKLKAVKALDSVKESELRAFFMSCIEETKKEIVLRRRLLNSNTTQKNIPSEVGLSSFLSSDKRKVMETMFSRQEFIDLLNQLIFPVREVITPKSPVKELLINSERLAPNRRTVALKQLNLKKRKPKKRHN